LSTTRNIITCNSDVPPNRLEWFSVDFHIKKWQTKLYNCDIVYWCSFWLQVIIKPPPVKYYLLTVSELYCQCWNLFIPLNVWPTPESNQFCHQNHPNRDDKTTSNVVDTGTYFFAWTSDFIINFCQKSVDSGVEFFYIHINIFLHYNILTSVCISISLTSSKKY